jgi:hypothetical protein
MDENEDMKKELRDLEEEIEEMQDNFRYHIWIVIFLFHTNLESIPLFLREPVWLPFYRSLFKFYLHTASSVTGIFYVVTCVCNTKSDPLFLHFIIGLEVASAIHITNIIYTVCILLSFFLISQFHFWNTDQKMLMARCFPEK